MSSSQPKSLRACLLEFLKAKKKGKSLDTNFGSFEVAIKILPDHALICDKTDQKFFKSKQLFAKLKALTEMEQNLVKLKDLEGFKFYIEQVSFIMEVNNPDLEYNKYLDLEFAKIGAKEEHTDSQEYKFEFDMVREDNRVSNEADAAIKYCLENPSEPSLMIQAALAMRKSLEPQPAQHSTFEDEFEPEARGHQSVQSTTQNVESLTLSQTDRGSTANEATPQNSAPQANGTVISLDETSVSSILPGAANVSTPVPQSAAVNTASSKIQVNKRSAIEPDFSDDSDPEQTIRTTGTKRDVGKDKEAETARSRGGRDLKKDYRDSSSEIEDIRGGYKQSSDAAYKKGDRTLDEKKSAADVEKTDRYSKKSKEVPPNLSEFAAQQLQLAQLLQGRKDLGLLYPQDFREFPRDALYSSLLLPSLAFGSPADLYRLNPGLFLGKRNPLEDQLIQDYQRISSKGAEATDAKAGKSSALGETNSKIIKEPTRSVSPLAAAEKLPPGTELVKIPIEKGNGTASYISSLLKKIKTTGLLNRKKEGLYEDLKEYKFRLKQLESTRASNIQSLAKQFIQGDVDYQYDAQQLTSIILEALTKEIEQREKALIDIEGRAKDSEVTEGQLQKEFDTLTAEKTELTARLDKILKKSERIKDAIKDCGGKLESERKQKDEVKEQLRLQKIQSEELVETNNKLKGFLKQTMKGMEHSRDNAFEPSGKRSEYEGEYRDKRYPQSSTTVGREKSQSARLSSRRDEDEKSKKYGSKYGGSRYYGEESDEERGNEKTVKSTTKDGGYGKRGSEYDERSNKQDQLRARELLLKKKQEMLEGPRRGGEKDSGRPVVSKHKYKREETSSGSESETYDDYSPERRHK